MYWDGFGFIGFRTLTFSRIAFHWSILAKVVSDFVARAYGAFRQSPLGAENLVGKGRGGTFAKDKLANSGGRVVFYSVDAFDLCMIWARFL